MMQWQKSPQYENMPHEQYLQTAEGQRATRAFSDWENWLRKTPAGPSQPGAPATPRAASPSALTRPDSWSWPAPQQGTKGNYDAYKPQPAARPGAAQPIPTRPQGTPYGGPAPVPKYFADASPEYMAANPDFGPAPWARPNFADQYNEYMSGVPLAKNETRMPAVSYGGGGAGDLAYAAPENRPAPFTQTVRGFDGNTYEPQDFANRRDAMIQLINEDRARMSAQSGQYTPEPLQRNTDWQSMWNQAGDMASNGWTNPLAGLFGPPMTPWLAAKVRQGYVF